jgi:hypothetical protein
MQANGQNQKKRALSWQPFLIGGLAFLLLTGGRIARPANLGWVMEGAGTNLLGWMFFRDAPVLQQPFGANWLILAALYLYLAPRSCGTMERKLPCC